MTAEEELVALCAGDIEPLLSSDELAQCLIHAAVPDTAGLYLNDDGWVPSYDMNRAASRAWRMKAAKVAADYTITIEGRELNRGQMIDNFLRQAQEFSRLAQPRYFAAPDQGVESWRV